MTRPHSSAALRAFAPAWLHGDPVARELLPGGFDDAGARGGAVQRAASRACSPDVVRVISDQHRGLAPSPARESHLEALAAGNAATVVSGQQVGLFTGPAFTIYKAAGVVACAKRLSEESGIRCVPVFWLQTEDHDWPEIDHCFVRGVEGGPLRIAVGDAGSAARVPVAARRYDESVEAALASLEAALAGRVHAAEVIELLRRHYRRDASPADAFRGVLAELFADDGLLLFDPRAPEVAALTRTLYDRALSDAEEIAGVLSSRAAEIAAAGYAVQVPVRDGAPLCFFHPDAADGPRYRLEPRGRGWRLCDDAREIARDEALRILLEDPLRFSSSALLRPLLQDHLLPNAMYLAGPGEIAYFAELAPLYELLGVAMPLVAARPSFCVTGAGDRRRLEALGATFDGLGGRRDDALARFATSPGKEAFPPDRLESLLTGEFTARLDEFAVHALALDENLGRPIDKARAAVEHAVRRLAEKYRHSVLHRDGVLVDRFDRVRNALAPEGVPQERVYGFASLAAEHGVAALLAGVANVLEPFDGRMKEIAL